jgi:hypothetical protein
MNAICAGFLDVPKMCKRLLKSKNIEQDIGLGIVVFRDGYEPRHVLGIALLYFFGVVLFLCCYRRHARR